MPPPPPENREGHYDGQLPSCLIFWILRMRRYSIPDQQHEATYTPSVALCYRFVASPYCIIFHSNDNAFATLSRFCQAKSRIITIPATCRSLLRSLEGRLLRGRMIHVSQTIDGGSFNGVGLLSGLLFSGLLVRRLSRF